MDTNEKFLAPGLIGELLDVIHNALIVVNGESRIIFANSRTAKMFGTTTEELQGQNISNLFVADDIDILVPNILTITKTQHEFECESMFQRKDGTTFLGRISGTWFLWEDKHEGMAFSIHDISDMKIIEKSLRQAERKAFLGRLVDDISHQIRNPVMVIGGFARRLKNDHPTSRQAEAIIHEAERLEGLLDTLNHFIGLPRPRAKMIAFATLFPEMEKVAARVQDRGCIWECRYEEELLQESLLIDPKLFWEALVDVVDNACESYGPGSRERWVCCEILRSDSSRYPYVIRIVDKGRGIAAAALKRVFAHFYTDKTGRIGMGLTIARRIIEEQGGLVEIESAQGMGTVVTFHLVQERRRQIRTTLLDREDLA